MKTHIEIWNEQTNNLSWGETQLCQIPALKSMEIFAKQHVLQFKKWYDKLSPSEKCSVWSENGEATGLFTLSDERLVEIYYEKYIL